MISRLLYPLLLLGVLISGCARQSGDAESDTSMDIRAQDDSTEHTSAMREPSSLSDLRVVFMGDSITAGYGIDEDKAFPALVRERVQAAGMPVEVVNAGSSGETSTGGLGRINWLLRNSIDVLVLELGGNDALRGVSLDLTERNLTEIVQRTLNAYPDCRIIIAGMQVPPNLGHDYTEKFREMYPEIAARFDATLIPFILEDVGGVRERMQSDGIHPNVEGHAVIAETVWTYLEPVLFELMGEES